jgi:hypothetical protein
MRLFRVSQVARELGISVDWLRRSDGRVGIPKARRDMNGWRIYTEEDIAALRAVLSPGLPGEPRHDQRCESDEERPL